VGLDNPGAVDAVKTDTPTVELLLDAAGPWDGSDHRQILLQEKLNRYLEFVIDGDLAVAVPNGRRWIVVVEHDHPLDDRTAAYLRHADGEFQRRGGGVATRSRPMPPVG
jgi:hypothetical protein